MGGTFLSNRSYIAEEVYIPFADYEWETPLTQDVFVALSIELFDACEKSLGKNVWYSDERFRLFREKIETLETEDQKNNAFNLFCSIGIPEELPDLALILYFENTILLFLNEYDAALGEVFADLVIKFIDKYNMNYRMTSDYRILPLLTSEIQKIYSCIASECGPHKDLKALWTDFEEAYGALLRNNQKDADCKIPLTKCCMYLEAVAADLGGVKRAEGFASAVKTFEQAGRFPHKGSIRKSIENLYGLASDYPGIRHAGTPASKIRELDLRDVSHIGLLFFIWAGYMHSFCTKA